MNSEQMLEKANQLWQSLEAKDREWLRERKPSLDSAQMALMEVDEAIRTLKSWTITHQFETWQEEIAFFKVAKPKLIARFIYWSKVIHFLTAVPFGGEKTIKKTIESEMEILKQFSIENQDFIAYYRRNATFLDKKYFLRFQYDLYVKLPLQLHSFDDRFSTSHDHLVASILACDDYEIFLKNQLKNLKAETLSAPHESKGKLEWTTSKVSLTELIFALHQSRCFNNGNIDLSEMVRILEQTFAVDLGNYHKTFTEIKARKTSPTKFLDLLTANLTQYMEDTET